MALVCALISLGPWAALAGEHVHVWTEYQIVTQPTCTAAGRMQRTCTQAGCPAPVDSQEIAPYGHSWGYWQMTQSADCTHPGVEARTCTRCNTQETRTYAALGHAWGSWYAQPPANCTQGGLLQRQCQVCGAMDQGKAIPPTGHSWGAYQLAKAPTCTESGISQRRCVVCGAADAPLASPPLGHDFSQWKTLKQPTCTDKGSAQQVCSRCGQSGQTGDLPAWGHAFGPWLAVKPAACTQPGTLQQECSRCHLKQTMEAPALGHSLSPSQTTLAPTCSLPGESTAFCVRCATPFKTPIAAYGINSKNGHNFRNGWLDVTVADCTQGGSQQRICVDCGRTETRTTKKGPHVSSGKWVIVRKPTLQQKGLKGVFCTVCKKRINHEEFAPREFQYNVAAGFFGPQAAQVDPRLAGSRETLVAVDLTQPGTQQYPLVTSDGYWVATLQAAVAEGTLTVTYTKNDPGTIVAAESLLFFPGLDSVTPEALAPGGAPAYAFGQAIGIGQAQRGVLAVRLTVSYDQGYAGNTANKPFAADGTYIDGTTPNAQYLSEMTARLAQQE